MSAQMHFGLSIEIETISIRRIERFEEEISRQQRESILYFGLEDIERGGSAEGPTFIASVR